MYRRIERISRHALLALVYALGIAGIIASSSSGTGRFAFCDLVVRGIAPTTDGTNEVWVGVLALTDDGNVDRISRLAANGTERFGVDIAIGNDDNAVLAIAIAVDGAHRNDLYVGGAFSEGILRLNGTDGSIDNGFNVFTGFDAPVTSIVPAGDGTGDIYVGVAGNIVTYQGITVSGLVRLNENGSLDTGFGGSGAIVSNVESVAMDGVNVYSGGRTLPSLERWTPTGAADMSPNFAPPISINPVFSVLPAPGVSTDVYAGGGFANGIIRLSNAGNPVGTFIVGTGFDDDVASIVSAGAANEIYVGGTFTTYKGSSANGIIRLNNLGAIVGSFVVGTGFDDLRDTSGGSQVTSLALANDNDLFVGGGFTRYKGRDVNGLARLNPNGTPDAGFEVEIDAGNRICDNNSIGD